MTIIHKLANQKRRNGTVQAGVTVHGDQVWLSVKQPLMGLDRTCFLSAKEAAAFGEWLINLSKQVNKR